MMPPLPSSRGSCSVCLYLLFLRCWNMTSPVTMCNLYVPSQRLDAYAMAFSSMVVRALGLAPTSSSAFSPSLKTMKVGMARMPSSWLRSGSSSTSILAKKMSLNRSSFEKL
jgi:hypothetical protein